MKYDKELNNYYADIIGKCFEYSVEKKKDSYLFAKDFINSETGGLILTNEYLKPYFSFAYMFNIVDDELRFVDGETFDSYLMWMYGFLVKYWISNYNISPKDVWKILPIDEFRDKFIFYHTQGWEYIIHSATNDYFS